MHSLNSQIIAKGNRGLTRAVMRHLNDPNVSLIDLGWRIRDRQNYSLEPELCVRVHLRRKLRGEAFESFASRFPKRVVNAKDIGFPVDLPEADYKLHPCSWGGWGVGLAPVNPRSRVFNPLRGGIGVYNPLTQAYGTLGAKVIDRNNGQEMILSNWHVLAGAWYAPMGDQGLEVYQPDQSGNGSNNMVARLNRHAMAQNLDAAVAELAGGRPLINQQLDLGAITGARAPEYDMRVVKSGRASGVTSGVITGVDGYRLRYYEGRRQVIRNIIHIAQASEGGAVSSPGDSGSVWLEQNANRAVGLHFAGSDDPEYGLSLAMPQVLDALQVDLALQ